jgi:steroid delta-isomerase-like uncharacterized protein
MAVDDKEGHMSPPDHLHIVREVFAAWNAHDLNGYLKRIDQKCLSESDAFPEPFRGHDGARRFFQIYLTAFPDLHLDIEQVLPAGDHVVVRWRSTGTQRGPLMSVAPTHKRAELHGCSVFEIQNGKVVRSWVYFDNAHLLRQLGAMPA